MCISGQQVAEEQQMSLIGLKYSIICSRIQSLSAHMLSRIVSGKLFDKLDNIGVCTNHEPMHLTWKLWLQFVRNLQFSHVLTIHSEVSSLLFLSLFSTLYRGNRGVSSSLYQAFLFLHCCYFNSQAIFRDMSGAQRYGM